MSRHLVTGGAGFLGSALAHRLVAEGHDVTVLDRFSRGKHDRVPAEARTVVGDIRSPWATRRAVIGQDVVWHLAYIQGTQTFYGQPREVIDVALRGIMNVLRACEEPRQPPEFFLASSSEAYQIPPDGMYPTDETVPLAVPDVTNPRYSYGGGKIASEIATLAWADILPRAVIFRPHNVIGPDMGNDHVVPQLARRMNRMPDDEHDFPIQGDGTATRSFNYIDDAIDGLMVLLERGEHREVYHLGDPREEVTIADLAHRIARHYGRDIVLRPSALPQGSPTRRVPNISKLRALGYEPQVTLDEALARTLDWYARVPA